MPLSDLYTDLRPFAASKQGRFVSLPCEEPSHAIMMLGAEIVRRFYAVVGETYPLYIEELKGMADGARISFDDVCCCFC